MGHLEQVKNEEVVKNMNSAKGKLVGEILAKNAYLCPDRIALEWKDSRWTFKELNDEVNKVANSLLDLGVKKGERISVLTQNRAECSHILYAAAKIGAIVSFLNWRYSDIEMVEAMNVIKPSYFIVSDEFQNKVHHITDELDYIRRVILLDRESTNVMSGNDRIHFSYFVDLLNNRCEEPEVSIDEEEALYIVYTSGTTGIPKGAILSHRASIQRVIAQMATFPTLLNVNEDDICIARNPFFHVTSVDQMFATHAMKGKVLILAGFNPAEIVDVLEREYVSWLVLAPGMYESLINEIKSRNAKIKGLKAVGSMADLVPHETIAEITRLCQAPFFNTYGSTEIGMHCFSQNILPIGDDGVDYESMAKKEGFFCSVKLIDEQGKEVKQGEAGELILKTPMMFSGYWGNEEENKKVFQDGWFHTGDVFIRTPSGNLDYIARTKHMIKSGGENIYPAEIERVLLKHPNIREAVVISVPDKKWGETPLAYIAISNSVEHRELKNFCTKSGLAKYKIPKYFREVDIEVFPRNTTGKVVREKVQEWAKEGI